MTHSGAQEKPSWLRVKIPSLGGLETVRAELRTNGVATVCDSSRCPNLGECWGRGEATFMILGRICTRSCHFCAVEHGKPSPIDLTEPKRVAKAASSLGLRHVVVTSVTRDDLPDDGAGAFAEVVNELRRGLPAARVELLIPDMRGERLSLERVAGSGANVIGHNLEVVESLQNVARDPSASYDRSLDVLCFLAHEGVPVVKSSLMLGLGEEASEVRRSLRDMRGAGVTIVTIGQYLRPKGASLPVVRYVEPVEFEEHAAFARSIGFRAVLAGPLVRSSYHASEAYDRLFSGG
ncbi:MAG: lipoyl synthase [Methanomassiliicoccales archaeon]|nr:lipoyl synthase [Methanomassiliicoccales archaeon]